MGDRVRHEWTGTGVGTITLGPHVVGFQPFPASLNGESVGILIEEWPPVEGVSQHETCRGIYTHSGTTVTRDTVTYPASGAKVNFPSGLKHVSLIPLYTDVMREADAIPFDPADSVLTELLTGPAIRELAGLVGGGGGGADNFNPVNDAGNYSSTAFVIGTGGAAQNEWRKFTTTAAHKINFPTGLPTNAYGVVEVPEDSGSTFISASGISVNGVANRGGTGAALTFPGKICSWRRADDGTILVLGDTGEEEKAYSARNQNDQLLRKATLEDIAETSPSPTVGATGANILVLNYETGHVFNVALTANVTTLTFQNWPASGLCGTITLRLTQGAGPFGVTWPAAVDWGSAGAPTLSNGSGEFDILVFQTWNAGTKIFGYTIWQDA